MQGTPHGIVHFLQGDFLVILQAYVDLLHATVVASAAIARSLLQVQLPNGAWGMGDLAFCSELLF